VSETLDGRARLKIDSSLDSVEDFMLLYIIDGWIATGVNLRVQYLSHKMDL
jgi:hypothetical protein